MYRHKSIDDSFILVIRDTILAKENEDVFFRVASLEIWQFNRNVLLKALHFLIDISNWQKLLS